MMLSAGEKIRVILNRKDMSVSDLAKALGQSRQNLSNKLVRDNFTEKELSEIAKVLDCTYETVFKLNDSGETI
jgi:DNA-binding Xre family transcriptional regulator